LVASTIPPTAQATPDAGVWLAELRTRGRPTQFRDSGADERGGILVTMPVSTCERCGAALSAAPPGAAIRCGYCGTENTAPAVAHVLQVGNVQIRLPEHPMTVEQIEEGFREKAREEKERLRSARIFAVVFGGVILVVIGIAVLLTR
jgi:hypothetical protein